MSLIKLYVNKQILIKEGLKEAGAALIMAVTMLVITALIFLLRAYWDVGLLPIP